MIEAPAFQGVVNLTCAVGRDDHDGRFFGAHGSQFRNGDLAVGKHLQQESFKGFVGPVQLIDQKDRSTVQGWLKRLEDRALDQEPFIENRFGQIGMFRVSGGFRNPDFDHLGLVVPFIDGGGDVEALVTLKADQVAPQRGGENLGNLGLADTGFAFKKQRPLHLERKVQNCRE